MKKRRGKTRSPVLLVLMSNLMRTTSTSTSFIPNIPCYRERCNNQNVKAAPLKASEGRGSSTSNFINGARKARQDNRPLTATSSSSSSSSSSIGASIFRDIGDGASVRTLFGSSERLRTVSQGSSSSESIPGNSDRQLHDHLTRAPVGWGGQSGPFDAILGFPDYVHSGKFLLSVDMDTRKA